MSHAEAAYQHETKAIQHYTRLLAGDGLTRADKRRFRLLRIRAWFRRAAARRRIAETERIAA